MNHHWSMYIARQTNNVSSFRCQWCLSATSVIWNKSVWCQGNKAWCYHNNGAASHSMRHLHWRGSILMKSSLTLLDKSIIRTLQRKDKERDSSALCCKRSMERIQYVISFSLLSFSWHLLSSLPHNTLTLLETNHTLGSFPAILSHMT